MASSSSDNGGGNGSEEGGPSTTDEKFIQDLDAKEDESMEENECVECVNEEPKQNVIVEIDDDDDDVQITAQKGDIVNEDFPHNAMDCGKKRRGEQHPCKLCYCFVCDVPVSECLTWNEHSDADPKSSKWQEERENFRKDQKKKQSLAAMKHTDPMFLLRTALPDLSITQNSQFLLPLSFPQKHMYKFMQQNETHGVKNKLIEQVEGGVPRGNTYKGQCWGGIIAVQMGLGKTGSVIYNILENPMMTLIIVPPNLVFQWIREFAKFAPTLNVEYIYANSIHHKIEAQIANLHAIVVAATSKITSAIMKEVKRIVIDESHLFFDSFVPKSSFTSKSTANGSVKYDTAASLFKTNTPGVHAELDENRTCLSNIKYRWCLSGTPFPAWKDDNLFTKHMKFLFNVHWAPSLSDDATIYDAKQLVLRIDKDQKKDDGTNVTDIPPIEYDVLPFKLSETEKELYELLSCYEDCQRDPTTPLYSMLAHIESSNLTKFISDTFELRLLLLNNNTNQLKKVFGDKLMEFNKHCPDNVPLFDCYLKKQYEQNYIYNLISRLEQENDEGFFLSQLVKFVKEKIQEDSTYKVILVTDQETKQEMIHILLKKSGVHSGILNVPKGKTSVRAQHELSRFQNGEYKVLISSLKIMCGGGLNMQEACHIIFLDTVIDNDGFKQACYRIARFGTKHKQLKVTVSYVENTISHWVATAHFHRSQDDSLSIKNSLIKSMKDANAKAFDHEFESLTEYRVHDKHLSAYMFKHLTTVSIWEDKNTTSEADFLNALCSENDFFDDLCNEIDQDDSSDDGICMKLKLNENFPFGNQLRRLHIKFFFTVETRVEVTLDRLEDTSEFTAKKLDRNIWTDYIGVVDKPLDKLLDSRCGIPTVSSYSATFASDKTESIQPMIESRHIYQCDFRICKKCLFRITSTEHKAMKGLRYQKSREDGTVLDYPKIKRNLDDVNGALRISQDYDTELGEVTNLQFVSEGNTIDSSILIARPKSSKPSNLSISDAVSRQFTAVRIPDFAAKKTILDPNPHLLVVRMMVNDQEYKTCIEKQNYYMKLSKTDEDNFLFASKEDSTMSIAYIPVAKEKKRKPMPVAQKMSVALVPSPKPSIFMHVWPTVADVSRLE